MRSLLRANAAAEAPGYVELVEEHGPALVRLARGLVHSDEDAADLVQEVLASALVHWARVDAAERHAARDAA